MKIAVGILAHNEERQIATVLADLRQQTLFSRASSSDGICLHIVANGCTDSTAKTAKASFDRLSFPRSTTLKMLELDLANKTNAWNELVHRAVARDVTYIFMLDADIRLPQRDLLERSLNDLEQFPEAVIATDRSIGHFTGLSRFGLMRPLSLIFERPFGNRPAICGQFYCARFSDLRRIVLPAGLLSQDGYLRAMILTEGLTHPERPKRIRLVEGAFHLHPAYTALRSRFRFQVRQVIGSSINKVIYDHMTTMPADFDQRMMEFAKQNLSRPGWVGDLVEERIRLKGRLVPYAFSLGPAKWATEMRGLGRAKLAVLPFAIAFKFAVTLWANADVRKRRAGTMEANTGRFTVRR